MRFERRAPRWDDGYALAGLYFFPLLALAALAAARLPPSRLPRCGLKRLTGIPCPTCGAWRAACALADGDLAGAWRCQPLLVGVGAVLAATCLYAVFTALFRRPRLFPVLSRRERRFLWWLAAALAALNWVYLTADGR